jgi:hypothetical protein
MGTGPEQARLWGPEQDWSDFKEPMYPFTSRLDAAASAPT